MKKNLITRLGALILVLTMLLTLAVGCGAEEASTVSEAPAESTVESVPAEMPVEEPEAPPAEEPVDEASAEAEASVPEETAGTANAELSFSEQIEQASTGGAAEALMNFAYAEETVLPVTEEDVTFSYWFSTQPFMMAYGGEVDYDTLTFYREWQERTGVKLELVANSLMEVNEKFQLMIASGDYTNLIEGISGYTGGADAAINDEVIYELTDIVAEYMPNYSAWLDSNPNYRATASTVTGNLYNCAYLKYGSADLTMGGLINQDWLDEAGMDVPVTYDDMYDVLVAFKNNGHSGALWMTSAIDCISRAYCSGYDLIMDGFLNVDGTIKCTYIDDDMRDYLEMMNQWYSEGLVYTDFITIASSADTIDSGLVTGGVVGVYSGQFNTAETMMADSGITLTPFGNLRKDPEQTIHVSTHTTYDQGGTAIATSIDEDLVSVAAQMLDYLYSKEGVLLSNFGVEGEGLQFDENGNPELTDLVLNNPDLPMSAIGLVLYTKFGGAGINFCPREYGSYSEAYWNACKVWCDNVDNDYMLPYNSIFTTDEDLAVDNIMSDIETYVEENLLKFVIGDRSLDEWDAYVETLKGMGIEDAIDMYQTALDRYLA